MIAGSNANLVELYALPIRGEWGSRTLPSSVQNILNACVPESVSAHKTISPNVTPQGSKHILSGSRSDTNVDRDVMGLSVCPNPSHRSRTVFVRHMEERFTWEKVIATVQVGATAPMKWRGCLRGCLAYSDSNKANSLDPVVQLGLGNRGGDTQMVVDDGDAEMDSSVVQLVSLAQDGFGDRDFEDDA